MAFAIFYEDSDITSIAANINGNLFPSNADRQLAKAFWDAGLSTWQMAPLGQISTCNPGEPPNPLSRRIVINGTFQGQPLTLQRFRDLLYRIAAQATLPEASRYLRALADDMGGASGACEPYP